MVLCLLQGYVFSNIFSIVGGFPLEFIVIHLTRHYTKGVQNVLQIDIQKIHKALEFDFI